MSEDLNLELILRKQYLFSNVETDIPFMRKNHLKNGSYLYLGKDSGVKTLEDAKGREYIILGTPFNTLEGSIENAVKAFSGDDINDLVFNWTGKWIVFCNGEIQTDACGIMPAFYIDEKEWCVSSSLALLKYIGRTGEASKVSNYGLNWRFMPGSIYENVKGLLCTQKLVITERGLKVENNNWVRDYRTLNTEEKVRRMSVILSSALTNISKFSGKNIWIALTAGKDSRLVLASAISSKIKFNTFTFDYPDIASCDRNIPKKIAREMGFDHTFIKRKNFSKEKYDLYDRFTSGNSKGLDQQFYACGQYEQLPHDIIVIRSGIFEAAQRYARSIAGADIQSFKDGILRYYSTSFADERQKTALNEWLKTINNNPIAFVDIRDRMYVEQRVGGWLSAIEQSIDINDCESIQIANSRVMVSILLSASEEEREHLALSYKTIEYINTQLSKYPYNVKSISDKFRLITNVLLSRKRIMRYLNNRVLKRSK